MQGIPIRIEIGPRDLENKEITYVLRDTRNKQTLKLDKKVKQTIQKELETMQQRLYDNAKKMQEEITLEVDNFKDFEKAIKENKRCLVPWAETVESEAEIKEKTGAKSSCIPFRLEKKSLKGVKCFYSGKPATCWCFFAKSY